MEDIWGAIKEGFKLINFITRKFDAKTANKKIKTITKLLESIDNDDPHSVNRYFSELRNKPTTPTEPK